MLIKILGALDIFIAVCFWIFGVLHVLPEKFIFILGLILIIKGAIFIIHLNFVSILDIIVGGLIMLATIWAFPYVMTILIALFLLQKGIFSLL